MLKRRLAHLHASPARHHPVPDRMIRRRQPTPEPICPRAAGVGVRVIKCLDGLDSWRVRCQVAAQGAETGILFRVYDADVGVYLAALLDTRSLSVVTNFEVDHASRMALWNDGRMAFASAQAHGVVVGLPGKVVLLPAADSVLEVVFFADDRLALLLSRAGRVQVDTLDFWSGACGTLAMDIDVDAVVKAVARPPLGHSQPGVAGLLAVGTTAGAVHRIELVRDGPARLARPWIPSGRPVADLAFGSDTLVFATDQEVVELRLAPTTGTSRRTLFRGDYDRVVLLGERVVAYARFGGRREVSEGVVGAESPLHHGRLRWVGVAGDRLCEVRERPDGVVVDVLALQ
jgi:hypothetical protein